jgi:hypothetical protein
MKSLGSAGFKKKTDSMWGQWGGHNIKTHPAIRRVDQRKPLGAMPLLIDNILFARNSFFISY